MLEKVQKPSNPEYSLPFTSCFLNFEYMLYVGICVAGKGEVNG
jgi:hypothetical protein